MMLSYKTPLIILILLTFFVTMSQVHAENPWQLSKDEDGIQVHIRHNPASVIKTFKGTMAINSRLSSLVAAIQDTQAYPRWLHNCKSARTIKTVGNNQVYNYVVTGMPWPVADRDSIVRSVLTQNKSNNQTIIKLTSEPNMLPLKQEMVRIQSLTGQWLLASLTKGDVSVTYEMSVDPGGNIPKWLVNMMAVDLPFNTLQKLRSIVKEARYVNARVENIID